MKNQSLCKLFKWPMSSLFSKSINIRDKGQCEHKGEKDKLELQDKWCMILSQLMISIGKSGWWAHVMSYVLHFQS